MFEQDQPHLTVPTTAAKLEGLLTDDLDLDFPEPKTSAPEKKPDAQDDDAKPNTEEPVEEEPSKEEPTAKAEEEEEEEGVEDDQGTPEAKYEVKVGDETVTVTLDEMARGYSRQSDYTRKTQAVAEERKQLEVDAEGMREDRAAYVTMVKALQDRIVVDMGPEPDWDKLQVENPVEFGIQHAAWQRKKAKADATQQEIERVQSDEVVEATTRAKKHLAGEQVLLLERIPAWKDKEVAKKEKSELVEYAISQGFTEEELNGASDHRALFLMRKAMKYDALQKKAPAIIKEGAGSKKEASPVLTARAPRRRNRATKLQESLKRSNASGSRVDAQATLMHLLGDIE